jgi:cardiolipin synthase A/B
MFSWSVAYYASEWIIRLVMLVVVTYRRRPNSSVSWLLVIFFMPWLGLAFYMLIGSNRFPRRRIRRHSQLLQQYKEIELRFQDHPSIVHPQLEAGLEATVRLAESLGEMPIFGGNAADLITDTDDAIERIISDIDAAEKHVHLLFYIYADDETGHLVSDALARAAKRGVRCRVLVDAVGSRPMLKSLAPQMRQSGVELYESLPVNLFRRKMARIDMRNHRKLVVIDGRIGYTGSQNIVNASYGHKDLAWKDIMVRLTGPVVLQLQDIFMNDWFFETDEVLDGQGDTDHPPISGEIAVQTLPSGPNYPTENYQRLVVAALHAARRRVTITTPYFVPDLPFMQALQVAVLRGVEVELIVPERSDQILVRAASRAYYGELLDLGVKLHLYTDGILHSKTMTIDSNIALLGTSNFDIRSFSLNFEVNLIFYGAQATEVLRCEQEKYLKDCYQLTHEEWDKKPRALKVMLNVAKLLSPLL